MPELPDVEAFRNYIDSTSLHRKIRRAEVLVPDLLEGVKPVVLTTHLEGRELASTRRHGKNLFVEVRDGKRGSKRGKREGWLHLHFGMTGGLDYSEKAGDGEVPEYTVLRLDFADGSRLAYTNLRKLGKVGWVDDVDAWIEDEGLGPDPLEDEVHLERFREMLRGRRGTLKGLLMNQTVLAGLGNELVDEILFQLKLAPKTEIPDLDDDSVARIYRALYDVMETVTTARVRGEELPDDYLLSVREKEAPCPRCGHPLATMKVAGRTSYYCPEEQS